MSDDAKLAAPMPENIRIVEEADAIRLSYRWFSPKYVFMVAFCVAWD